MQSGSSDPQASGGCFLASSPCSGVLRVSRQERGRANFGLQPRRLTFLMDSRAVLLLRSVFPFTQRCCATPGLLLPLKRRRLRRPSPHHRVVHVLSPAAYRQGLPTVGRWRASPVMVQDHFPQAVACPTVGVRDRHSARSLSGRVSGSRQRFIQGRCLAHPSGLSAVSQSLFAWPLRPSAFSGIPGRAKLAAYLRRCLRSSSKEFCTGADPHR